MTTHHDSFAYAAHRRSAKQQACLDLINKFSFLRENNAPESRLQLLREDIEEALADFTADCDRDRKQWITRTIRAIALGAFGEFREAIALESEALGFAEDDVDLSKNLSNRSDYARRLAATMPDGAERAELLNSALNDGVRA